MEKMNRVLGAGDTGSVYLYEGTVQNGDVIVKLPEPFADNCPGRIITWQVSGNAKAYGTLTDEPESEKAIWTEVNPAEVIEITVTALKFTSTENDKVAVRAILY